MRRCLRNLLILFFALSIASIVQAQTAPSADINGAYRFERAHWIYVHLHGTPHQIGFQHGYLLAPEIEQSFRVARLDNTHGTGRSWQFFRDTAKNIYWPHIEPQYRQNPGHRRRPERPRSVRNIDLWDIVALNAFLETPQYYVPWLDEKQHKKVSGGPMAPGNCSAFVATGDWTSDHHPVIAHSMWYPIMSGEDWRIIFDVP